MNYGTDRSEVICRTYVRKTLISEKVAYNLEDAKQVLDCAESLHPCRGAGRAKDFTYDVLTKKLEPQISHSDGLVFSVTCKGAVKQQAWIPGRTTEVEIELAVQAIPIIKPHLKRSSAPDRGSVPLVVPSFGVRDVMSAGPQSPSYTTSEEPGLAPKATVVGRTSANEPDERTAGR
ncbi:hypothetical protein MRX96_051168 [Rhipicephalus microplus]